MNKSKYQKKKESRASDILNIYYKMEFMFNRNEKIYQNAEEAGVNLIDFHSSFSIGADNTESRNKFIKLHVKYLKSEPIRDFFRTLSMTEITLLEYFVHHCSKKLSDISDNPNEHLWGEGFRKFENTVEKHRAEIEPKMPPKETYIDILVESYVSKFENLLAE